MRNLKRILIAAVAILAMAMPTQAQFRFGVKGGLNINSLHFTDLKNVSDELTNTENRTGWNAGITTEFTVPIIGIGADASILYVHRVNSLVPEGMDATNTGLMATEYDKDYLEIPINLKYKLALPVVEKIVIPYAFTGPSFAFLCSKDDIEAAITSKKFDMSWNLGAGVELFKHLQVGAQYSWGLTDQFDKVITIGNTPVNCKKNGWTVSAALFF